MRAPRLLVVLSLLGLSWAGGTEPTGEIVVSMRYPQQTGTSHAHLYLYRADGKLLRQLTDDDCGQEIDPIFAPDGETIVFTRKLPGDIMQCWSVRPRGNDLHPVPAPEWYTQTKTSPRYDHFVMNSPNARESMSAAVDPREVVTPDGKTAVKLVPAAGVEDPKAPDKWDVQLRLNESGHTTKVGELLGYAAGFLSIGENHPEECFLRDGSLNVAFCFVHLGSTDGDTVYAFDLPTKRLIRLSTNMANPVPLRGEEAFLTLTQNLYVPYGDGKHTADCLYVERWDAGWKAIRYAKDTAPGVCYGASMYRPGRTPAGVTIRHDFN